MCGPRPSRPLAGLRARLDCLGSAGVFGATRLTPSWRVQSPLFRSLLPVRACPPQSPCHRFYRVYRLRRTRSFDRLHAQLIILDWAGSTVCALLGVFTSCRQPGLASLTTQQALPTFPLRADWHLLRVLPQFDHARQVFPVRRLPALPPRLARHDPPAVCCLSALLSTVLSRHLPRARNAWRPSCAELRCVPMLLLADAHVDAARRPHRHPRRRLK